MQVVGALLYLSGELHFLNNSGGEESALHILSFAQVVLSRGLYVNFEGNSGRSVSLTCRNLTRIKIHTSKPCTMLWFLYYSFYSVFNLQLHAHCQQIFVYTNATIYNLQPLLGEVKSNHLTHILNGHLGCC